MFHLAGVLQLQRQWNERFAKNLINLADDQLRKSIESLQRSRMKVFLQILTNNKLQYKYFLFTHILLCTLSLYKCQES